LGVKGEGKTGGEGGVIGRKEKLRGGSGKPRPLGKVYRRMREGGGVVTTFRSNKGGKGKSQLD